MTQFNKFLISSSFQVINHKIKTSQADIFLNATKNLMKTKNIWDQWSIKFKFIDILSLWSFLDFVEIKKFYFLARNETEN